MSKLRLNENPELTAEYKAANLNHTAEQWIVEALNVNNQHCNDDAIAVSNLLILRPGRPPEQHREIQGVNKRGAAGALPKPPLPGRRKPKKGRSARN